MPGEVTPEILATADTIQSEGLRAETLELVQYLCAIGNGGHRARVLDVLVDNRWKKSP